MFLKVKRFQHFEDLIFESNIIRLGDEFTDVESNQPTGDAANTEEGWIKLDRLLDQLIDQGILDLEDSLKNPLLDQTFGSERGRKLTESYLVYCTGRVNKIKERIAEELKKPTPNLDLVNKLTLDIVAINERIDALDKIYEALKARQDAEVSQAAETVSQQIKEISKTIEAAYLEPIEIVASQVKDDISKAEAANSPEEAETHAANAIDKMQTAKSITSKYPPHIKDAITDTEGQVEAALARKVGADKVTDIKNGVTLTREESVILKRIVELKYTDFTSLQEIETAIDQIALSINGLSEHSSKRPESAKEVIEYLTTMLNNAAALLRARAQDKNLDVKGTKGIHFDFNKKLKLYEKVELPVTGKQIADDTLLMKLRKKLKNLLDLFLPGSAKLPPGNEAGAAAFAEFGTMVYNIYAKTLNTSAKVIGKAVKGREGEMKADALSRQFIPGSAEILDVKEDMGGASAPGVSPQVPGSIGGMGAIVPPTQTSLGSGDNFNLTKKKNKKKKHSMILGFADFVRENNHH